MPVSDGGAADARQRERVNINMHNRQHPLSGAKVKLNDTTKDPVRGMVMPGMVYRIEGWWDSLTGESWTESSGNPAAMQYTIRVATSGHVPLDDEVVYGHINGIGHLVHVSELSEEPVEDED